MSSGIKMTDRARQYIFLNYNIKFNDFVHHSTTSGIILILSGDIYVNARIIQGEDVKIVLDNDQKGNFFLKHKQNKYPVKLCLPPSYIHKKNSEGFYYKEAIMTHADRIRISPIVGCAFRCKYCDIHYSKYRKIPLQFLLEGIELALAENIKPRHLLISGGTPIKKDIIWLDNIYKKVLEFCNNKNLPVDIMLAPRTESGFLEKLKKYNVNGLAINLEIYNTKIAKEINPQKATISRDFYLEFIARAVKIFGKGKIRSLLIVGLEPIEDTLKGVEELAKTGCDVVLSPFVPYKKTLLSRHIPPSYQDLEQVFLESLKIVNKYKVKLGPRCKACQHNTLAFPQFL